ncbi:hypothetical protein PR003_g27708 [Phytophthora rubi]|uniref:Uncharacterized protein n=1 Tax=Phytophthora rubi TaxID=129364 RepID=A0A6A4C5F6_9STRA|nr:hypothetical protein PR002_g27280 [Phytophthora rubi]KAE8991602.1 hypothetical protein PR001_g21176 [Phytophthora rubi]KAE9281326.1 hypothetical protein PR003_g27708 [Phytophthora rubi]
MNLSPAVGADLLLLLRLSLVLLGLTRGRYFLRLLRPGRRSCASYGQRTRRRRTITAGLDTAYSTRHSAASFCISSRLRQRSEIP